MALAKRVAVLSAAGVMALVVGVHGQNSLGDTADRTDVTAGKKVFVQRCSVCHMPPLGPGEPRPYARTLTGYIKSPETEATARRVIENGVPSRMPGFKLGLTSTEIDQLVTYLSSKK